MKKQIIYYFTYLIKTPKYTNDEKILKWRNLEDKLLENPQPKSYLCQTSKRYKQSFKECNEILIEFIDNSLELFESFLITDAQTNESFHSLKSRFTPKIVCWKSSWKLRICLAVLQWNLGDEFRPFLEQKLDFSISEENSELLSRIEKSLKKKQVESKTPEARRKRNAQRKLKRNSNKDDPEGHKYKDSKQQTKRKRTKKRHDKKRTSTCS